MAYQDVGTPRFYVNILEYLGAIGYTEINNRYRTNPASMESGGQTITTSIPLNIFPEESFVAYLGHTGGDLSQNEGGAVTEIINGFSDVSPNAINPDRAGFSIVSFNGLNLANEITTYNANKIGSIVVGNYYDMPHSPDLSLTMTREYGGIKTIETKGGASLSNAFYTKPPKWGDASAWEIYTVTPTNHALSRSGRRIWDLSFSYLSSRDSFGANSLMSQAMYTTDGYVEGEWDGDEDWYYNTDGHGNVFSNKLAAEPSFYAQVIHKTNGGQLPFIFQPDKNNNNPDQFAICKFDMKSFEFEQVANGVYNMKLKIREVW